MKKQHLKNLAIKKITVSKINGGATDANNSGVLSIGKNCSQPTYCGSVRNSRAIFCNDQDSTLC